jgi:hypothetical protein
MHTRLFALVTTVFLGACTQLEALQTNTEQLDHMALSPNPIVPIVDPNSLVLGDPAAEIFEMASGTTTNKGDIDYNNQKIQNQIFTLVDEKVDRAGDTMTGTLTINAPSLSPALVLNAATNQTALAVNGDGLAVAATFIAGANNGAISAQSSDAAATIEATNSLGIGLSVAGSTSAVMPALSVSTMTAPTGAVPRVGTQHLGYIWMTGADPNPTVNPGADNAIHGANIPKMWVVINDSYAIQDGYNIASITNVGGSVYRATFVRPMANTTYMVKVHVHGAPGYSGSHNGTKATTHFDFILFKTDTLALGFGTATEAAIEVIGRQ